MFRMLRLRPPHGWLAVAWELAIVSVGVLLALGAQQAAESFNQRREAAETRTALTNEIQETLAILELRRAAQPCIDKRLSEVRAIVNEWGRTGGFKTPSWVSQATWFAVGMHRFDAAQSAGRLALLSSEEQYRFGLVVGGLRNFQGVQLREIDAWSTLRPATGPPSASRCRTPQRSITWQRSMSGRRFSRRRPMAGDQTCGERGKRCALPGEAAVSCQRYASTSTRPRRRPTAKRI
jgi:hypothetical protein